MYGLETSHRVRRAVLCDGMSEREAARLFGLDRGTISKIKAARFTAIKSPKSFDFDITVHQRDLVSTSNVTERDNASRRECQTVKVRDRIEKRCCRIAGSDTHITTERDSTRAVDCNHSTRAVTNRCSITYSTLEIFKTTSRHSEILRAVKGVRVPAWESSVLSWTARVLSSTAPAHSILPPTVVTSTPLMVVASNVTVPASVSAVAQSISVLVAVEKLTAPELPLLRAVTVVILEVAPFRSLELIATASVQVTSLRPDQIVRSCPLSVSSRVRK